MKLTINLDKIQIIVRPFYKTVYQLLNFLYYKVPHFCFNKKLFISGNCRMCIVEVENMPKPVVSCALPVSGNLTINTKTPFVSKARENVLEFLLNNHPLDCPVCDQGGECDLQELSKYHGSGTSRFFFKKATTSSKNINSLLSTSMNRCINCTKCVRLAFYIGVNTMSSVGRSIDSQIFHFKSTNYAKNMYLFSSLIEICPVGQVTIKKGVVTLAIILYFFFIPIFLNLYLGLDVYYSFFICILSFFTTNHKKDPYLFWLVPLNVLSIYLTNGFFLIILGLRAISLLLKERILKDGHYLQAVDFFIKSCQAGFKAGCKYYGIDPHTAGQVGGLGAGLFTIDRATRFERSLSNSRQILAQEARSTIASQAMAGRAVGSTGWHYQNKRILDCQCEVDRLIKVDKEIVGVVTENVINVKNLGLDVATHYGF